MKLTLRSEAVPLGLVGATFVVAALAWPGTPERVPTHFGLDGRPDGWGSRAEGLAIFPVVAVFLYLITLLPVAFAKGDVPEAHERPLRILRVALPGFVLAMFGIAIAAFHGRLTSIAVVVYPVLALLLAVVAWVCRRLATTPRPSRG